ncbi:MAG TPA: nitroreductase/quinone reductase family protein [Burkholderiales bacterium]|nr:nitroreductase/quinone reductase family protein [Burkholderiales bacterium]
MRIPEAFFVVINPAVRFLLRSPIHWLWSGSLMLITFTGRRTGKAYTTPVRYLESGDAVWVFTGLETRWWKNLGGGATVSLRIRGEENLYRTEVVADAPDKIRSALGEFLAHFPQDVPYYEIALGADGRISQGDLEKAAARTVWIRAYPKQ